MLYLSHKEEHATTTITANTTTTTVLSSSSDCHIERNTQPLSPLLVPPLLRLDAGLNCCHHAWLLLCLSCREEHAATITTTNAATMLSSTFHIERNMQPLPPPLCLVIRLNYCQCAQFLLYLSCREEHETIATIAGAATVELCRDPQALISLFEGNLLSKGENFPSTSPPLVSLFPFPFFLHLSHMSCTHLVHLIGTGSNTTILGLLVLSN